MNQAPNFTLSDQHGTQHSLSEYAGKWLVLYFYPQDETPGCTAEACAFRDGREDLAAMGAEVVGISADTVESHAAFAENHELNFTLLADPKKIAIKAYGTYDEATGKTRRFTFLITPEGNIAKKYEDVTPAIHTVQIIDDLKTLQ
jgi:thioredoxin-dependent peroxiredoxin